MILNFNCVQDDFSGEKWQVLFNKTWPFYKQWFLSEGLNSRKGYLSSENMLRHHMPELIPVFGKLSALAGGDLEARFLSMYCPPPYMSGCSQLAWNRDDYFLIRNYDYNPALFEAVLLHTNWLKPVIGMSDCNWGLLDGMNIDGLTASLAFGGKKISGIGFGIPLIIRYLLETTSTVNEAISRLKGIPVHMAYNVTLADASGNYATVYLSPDKSPIITSWPMATNHQEIMEWPEYAKLTSTTERKNVLETIHNNPFETQESIIDKFLQPPLFNYNYKRSFGTLYTSLYHITDMRVQLFWLDYKSISQSFNHFTETKIAIQLPDILFEKKAI